MKIVVERAAAVFVERAAVQHKLNTRAPGLHIVPRDGARVSCCCGAVLGKEVLPRAARGRGVGELDCVVVDVIEIGFDFGGGIVFAW